MSKRDGRNDKVIRIKNDLWQKLKEEADLEKISVAEKANRFLQQAMEKQSPNS